MGEYADYECERSFNEIDWNEDTGLPPSYGDTYRPPSRLKRKTFVCKYCKQGGFIWHEHEGNYRLFTTTGELHSCKQHSFEQKESRDVLPRPAGLTRA